MFAYNLEQHTSDPIKRTDICISRKGQNSKFVLNSGKKHRTLLHKDFGNIYCYWRQKKSPEKHFCATIKVCVL